jgi:methylmalonyl-CoA mutase N-terminal domain/subunit
MMVVKVYFGYRSICRLDSILPLTSIHVLSEKNQELNGNIFAELMEAVKVCSLGQITNALYEVGGQYRRNM